MMVFRRKRTDDVGKIQMAPMIDVVFQLLIFFLVASEVRLPEADFRANLPRLGPAQSPARPVPNEIFRVYLRTVEAGKSVEVSINDEVVGRGVEAFKTLSERLGRLKRTDNAVLVIDGDPDVRTQFLTNALDCVADANVPHVAFAKART